MATETEVMMDDTTEQRRSTVFQPTPMEPVQDEKPAKDEGKEPSLAPSYSSVIEGFMGKGLTVLNPCKCCMACCGDKALRIGTFIVAALYIVDTILNVIPVLITITFPPAKKVDNNGRPDSNIYADLERFSKILTETLPIKIIVLLCSAYDLACGVLLVVADLKMKKTLCFAYSFMSGLNILVALIQTLAVSYFVNSDGDEFDRKGKHRSEFLAVYWFYQLIRMGFLLYYFLCGFALYIQIKDRQNLGKIQPDVIEWDDDDDKKL